MKNNFRFWLIYSLAWIPYALGYATVFATQFSAMSRSLIDSVHNILPAALLGVGVVWLCRKFDPAKHNHFVFGIAQLLLAIAYAALWNLLVPLSFALEFLLEGYKWQYNLFTGYAIQWQFFAGLMIYATIASIIYTLEFSRRVREEQARALRAEHLRTAAELNALRAQLNPHFLFNTLHTLMALVRRDSSAAENAIERLASLLRYSLKTKNDVANDDVPFFTEWEFVQNYLAIERLRLGDKLEIKADLSPDALDFPLPAFTLQPLIENTIKHAVSNNPNGTNVSVIAQIENESLRLEVADNGAGISPEKVFSNGGTGLHVVRQRLETRYRGKSEFKIETGVGAGFKVSMLIPHDAQGDSDE